MICAVDPAEISLTNQNGPQYAWAMAVRKTDSRRGGFRKGSGRKPIFESRARVTFDLERANLEALNELAEARQVSLSQLLRDVVEALLRRGRN